MTRIFATAKKAIQIDVVGQSVVVRPLTRRGKAKPTTRTFRNRYTLRKFLSAQVAQAQARGFVSVNR